MIADRNQILLALPIIDETAHLGQQNGGKIQDRRHLCGFANIVTLSVLKRKCGTNLLNVVLSHCRGCFCLRPALYESMFKYVSNSYTAYIALWSDDVTVMTARHLNGRYTMCKTYFIISRGRQDYSWMFLYRKNNYAKITTHCQCLKIYLVHFSFKFSL